MLTYLQAIILGIIQGASELFPVSSLGHTVLVANLFGWHEVSKQQTAAHSTFVSLVVYAHIATAIVLFAFYRREWARIVRSVLASLRAKNMHHDADARFGWLLLLAAVPAILLQLALEFHLRKAFATTFFAIVFIITNGILLIRGDVPEVTTAVHRPRQRIRPEGQAASDASDISLRAISDRFTPQRAVRTGVLQTGALLAGFSRSGLTMLAGLRNGLNHAEAARFSFLLLSIVLLASGLLGLPSVTVNGPVLAGALGSALAALLAVRFLSRYFRTKSLRPFGLYCIGIGVLMLIVSIVRGTPQ